MQKRFINKWEIGTTSNNEKKIKHVGLEIDPAKEYTLRFYSSIDFRGRG